MDLIVGHFALLGQKRKYIKLKTTAKFIEKRTSIAAVRAKLGQIGTFLTPVLSHCRLPLILKMIYKAIGSLTAIICVDPDRILP
jgi:hypothetical protein